ncbi:minor tail protein [Gordonia phage GMA2]|uniref:Minor tail protein n=1 Tax=Gordonia phage GMA2 TaxID=1647283 RepID=A0A0K0N6V9_9CAUD|nr:minor tail protein [Gordonia phage GMA2]AKJ72570.1 hypothetical protein GMA2_32 [Gordonia phage GMA2]
MTSPDRFLPGGASTVGTIANLQNADKESLATGANIDVIDMVENIAGTIFQYLLNGFENIVSAIEAGISDFIEDLAEAIGVDGTMFDISMWYENLKKLLSGQPIDLDPTGWFDGLADFLSGIAANFAELLQALRGEYTGDDTILIAIQNVTKPIRVILDPVTGLIQGFLLPLLPIGLLTDGSTNLLGDGTFDVAPTSTVPGTWFHSPTGGQGGTGATACQATGLNNDLMAAPKPVPGDELTFTAAFRATDTVASSEYTVEILGRGYDASNVLVEEKKIAQGKPGTSWENLGGSWTPISTATQYNIVIRQKATMTAGTVYMDNAKLSKPESIPQAWIRDLIGDLTGLFDWIDTAISTLLGSFGLPSIGTLLDKIMNLGDELADFFGLGQDTAGGLDSLLDKLLHNPLEVLGTIPQTLVSGLTSALNNANSFIQNVVNIIIQGIKKVPIVGGTIANLLEAVTGLTNTVETTETNVTIVQTQVTAVQEVFSVTSTKPLWASLDPTADSSFPLAELRQPVPHTHTYGEGSFPSTKTSGSSGIFEFSVTGIQYVGSNIRVGEGGVRDQIGFIARRSGSVPNFYAYVFKITPDGRYVYLTQTGNMAPDLTTSSSWITARLNDQVIVEPGDTILVMFSADGGTTSVMGIQTVFPTVVSGFRPRQIGIDIGAAGISWDGDGNPFITTTNADSAYSQKTPYIELGRDIGQTAKRSFFDNFNRDSLGSNWLLGRYDGLNGTSGGSNLALRSYRVENVSDQPIQQRAWGMYTVPLATDHMSCDVDVTGNDSPECGLMICASSTQSNFMALSVTESTAVLVTANSPSGSGASIRATTSNAGAGRWSLAYNIADNTYRAYKNGTQVMSWVDSANTIQHGQGQRFCGMFIDHKNWNSGPGLDNWHAYDIVEA